ncbi:MAG: GW dipeptide domain-containing protein [Bacteroidota bacterium]
MKVKLNLLIILVLVLTASSCGTKSESIDTTVKVKEVEQVSDYTYLLVKSKKTEFWIAVPTIQASPGETYHYQGGMLMKDFYSKELDRTFDEVLFVEALFTGDDSKVMPSQEMTPGSMAPKEKAKVAVEKVAGTVTIAEIYADPEAYKGKTVRVKGEVTRFNPAIMERNWVHLQDGTEFEGKFDLTATSNESLEVGTVVILEGILALNLDFGYGYSYEVLLEKATVVQ